MRRRAICLPRMISCAMSKTSCGEATTADGRAPMAVSTLLWKLASPYDAYVSHVARLEHAIDRLGYLSERALGFQAGLQGSVRLVPGAPDPGARAERFRAQLGQAASQMSDEEFE